MFNADGKTLEEVAREEIRQMLAAATSGEFFKAHRPEELLGEIVARTDVVFGRRREKNLTNLPASNTIKRQVQGQRAIRTSTEVAMVLTKLLEFWELSPESYSLSELSKRLFRKAAYLNGGDTPFIVPQRGSVLVRQAKMGSWPIFTKLSGPTLDDVLTTAREITTSYQAARPFTLCGKALEDDEEVKVALDPRRIVIEPLKVDIIGGGRILSDINLRSDVYLIPEDRYSKRLGECVLRGVHGEDGKWAAFGWSLRVYTG
jgi:hypothetical protein